MRREKSCAVIPFIVAKFAGPAGSKTSLTANIASSHSKDKEQGKYHSLNGGSVLDDLCHRDPFFWHSNCCSHWCY